jgi:RNA polymerase sigma-70 factor (ECF subfamily)
MTADSKTCDDGNDPITIALKDGDVRERLFKAARTSLCRYSQLSSPTQINAEAEEIVSGTIKEVLRRRSSYDADSDLVAWMVGFTFNVARDYVRKNARTPTGPPPGALQLEDLAVDMGCPVGDELEKREYVDRLLTQLTANERRLIEMKYRDEMTFAEIAEQMQMNENAVRVRHHRIMLRLRQLAGDSGEVQS